MGVDKEPKRFEDWTVVDCNDCKHYWDDSCSGVKPTRNGTEKPCNAFLATKRVDIPEQIKSLKMAINGLYLGCFVLGIFAVLSLTISIARWL